MIAFFSNRNERNDQKKKKKEFCPKSKNVETKGGKKLLFF